MGAGDYSRYDNMVVVNQGKPNWYLAPKQTEQQVPNSGANAGGYYGSGWYDQLAAISAANNAFNLEQVHAVNAYNAHEAQKNRDWQERMSNTAHQREVADLKAAGLNPILSAMGQGAFTGSGATASGQKAVADNVLGNGIISLMNSLISAASAQSVANTYAAASMYSADVSAGSKADYYDVLKTITGMNNMTSSANSERNSQTQLLTTLMRLIPAAITIKAGSKAVKGY